MRYYHQYAMSSAEFVMNVTRRDMCNSVTVHYLRSADVDRTIKGRRK